MKETVTELINLFKEKGYSMYGGEAVTQLQHGLQAATAARSQGASATLITAALLHDVGHLLHALPDNAPDVGIDDYHENLGARYLEKHFLPEVAEPVRLHVSAKRYLCAVDQGYLGKLSAPSLLSLQLQGGPMNEEEIAAFEAEPFYKQAVQLRYCDEMAKNPDWITEPIESFIPEMEQSLK